MKEDAKGREEEPAGRQVKLSRERFVWLSIAGGALALLALVCAAPWLLAQNRFYQAGVIYQALGFLCHQLPERSFYFYGHPVGVCARCLGLYTGFALGALTCPAWRGFDPRPPARMWLLVALAPTALDYGLDFLGLWSNTHYSRLATGALLGAASAFYVVPGFIDLSGAVAKKFFRAADRDKLPSRAGL